MSDIAATIRAQPLSDFALQASEINDSDALMAVYAAPEWDELSEDGQQWVCALVRETLARASDRAAGNAPAAQPNPIASADTAAGASQARPDGDLCSGRSTSLDRGA